MRDTGSTTCVIKRSLVEAEQMTGNHELCMLIDGVVKRFPTAFVRINTPYYTDTDTDTLLKTYATNVRKYHSTMKGTVKALCMENPVQELIVGNVPGAVGVEACYEVEVAEQREMIGDKHKIEYGTQLKQIPVENEEGKK